MALDAQKATEGDLRAALMTLAQQLHADVQGLVRPPRRLRVVVSARWATLASVVWSDALADPALRTAHLRGQLDAMGIDSVPEDRCVLDDSGRFGQPCSVAVYSATLMSALQDMAAALDAHLECVLPIAQGAAVCAREQTRGRATLLAVAERDELQFVHIDGRGLRFGATAGDADLADGTLHAVERLWQRQRLRDGPSGNAPVLHLADLRDGTPRADEPKRQDIVGIDLHAGRGTLAPSAALGCAMHVSPGMTLDGVAAAAARAWWRVWATALCLLTATVLTVQSVRQHAAAQKPSIAAHSALPPMPAPTRAQVEHVRSINAAIRELNFPVTEVLDALQPPRGNRVALTGLDIEPHRTGAAAAAGTASIKINASAPDAAAMASYLTALNQRRPRSTAQLQQHQLDATDASQRLRFTIEWAWQE